MKWGEEQAVECRWWGSPLSLSSSSFVSGESIPSLRAFGITMDRVRYVHHDYWKINSKVHARECGNPGRACLTGAKYRDKKSSPVFKIT